MAMTSYLLKSTIVGALGGLLFGFDTAVIAGTTQQLTVVYHLTPFTLGLTVFIGLVGTVIGAMSAGVLGQRIGGREALRIMAILYTISALGCAFAWNWPALMVFRLIGGLGIGGSSVLGPVYIAEIAPAKWRGRMVGLFQINVVGGILLAYLSNYLISLLDLGPLQWRWQLGVAGIPSLLFLIMLYGIPRSSRWLVTKNRTDEALAILKMMGSPDSEAELREIVDSIHLERGMAAEPLFKRSYRLPIFLAVTIGLFNQLAGINAILYYSNYIFASAGFSQLSSSKQTVLIGLMNLLATLLGMSLIDKLGRKTLLLIGSVGMTICLAGVAAVFFTHTHAGTLVWLLVAYIAFRLARRSDLGLHRRGVSKPRPLQGPEPRVILTLDHERAHLASFSGSRKILWRTAFRILCGHDDAAVLCCAVHLSRDERDLARAAATQTWHCVGCISHQARGIACAAF
jgi:MFS transporter, SP family, arabinose:H+ symporter